MQGAEAKLASASILNPVAASVQGKSRKVAKLHTGLRIPWWVIIVTLLGAAGLLWAFFEKSPVSFSFPTDPGLEKKASTGQLETRRALLKEEAYKPSDEDLRSRALAIAHILERSSNLSNRLAVICAGDSQRGSIEKFFADNSPGWHVDSVQAGPRVVELATLREAQLFRAITSNCSQGALLHLVTNPEGPPLLDWPLFEACEAQGQKGDADATPGWHTLLFRRVEGSGEKPLPSGSEKYEKVHLQTMLKDASGFMAFAKRDSALGTILKNIFGQGQWGLGTFLVAQGQLNGKTVLILKDFRGATSRE